MGLDEINKAALDRHITGNYGEDQYKEDHINEDEEEILPMPLSPQAQYSVGSIVAVLSEGQGVTKDWVDDEQLAIKIWRASKELRPIKR